MGALFLGALTSVAEVATSISAALAHHPELAVNNAVGSIVAQTAFIAVADLAYRRANLEHAAAQASNLMLIALFLGLNGLLILATSTPQLVIGHVHLASVVLIVTYVYGMRLVARSGELPMWHAKETAATGDEETTRPRNSGSLPWLWCRFIGVGVVVGISGVMLAHSGIALSQLTGLSETFVGALFTGVASSMPELVTALTAVRIGAVTLAISNIVGGNAFDSVIVALADIAYTPDSIYPHAGSDLQSLLGVALLMNVVVLLGLIRRERHGLANIGLDGVLLLLMYGGFVYLLL